MAEILKGLITVAFLSLGVWYVLDLLWRVRADRRGQAEGLDRALPDMEDHGRRAKSRKVARAEQLQIWGVKTSVPSFVILAVLAILDAPWWLLAMGLLAVVAGAVAFVVGAGMIVVGEIGRMWHYWKSDEP